MFTLRPPQVSFPCLSVECQHNFSGISSDYPAGADYLAALESTLLILSTVAKKVPVLLILRTSTGSTTTAPTSFRCCCTACAARTSRSSARAATFCSPTPSRCSTTPCATSCSTCTISTPFHRRRQRASSTSTPRAATRKKEIDNLYQSTEGNGLFLVQLLDSMHESNGLKNIPCQRGQHHSDAPRGPFVR